MLKSPQAVIKRIAVIILALTWLGMPHLAQANDYDAAVTQWKSHKDVGDWLDKNFKFDTSRQKDIQSRLRKEGPSAHRYLNPAKLFDSKKGYCVDAANFAHTSLNKINPEYNPRWIFIKNANAGKSSHWVTGYTVDGKLYVMDFGAGHGWQALHGIHGPYESLDEYASFLSSLNLKGFTLQEVVWRDMPGQEAQ